MVIKTGDAVNLLKQLDAFSNKEIVMSPNFQWTFMDNYDALKKVADKYDKVLSESISDKIKDGHFSATPEGAITPNEGYEEEFQKVAVKLNGFLMTDNEIEIKLIPRSETPEGLTLADLHTLKFMFE